MQAGRTSNNSTATSKSQQSVQSKYLVDMHRRAPKGYTPANGTFRKEAKCQDAGAKVEAKLTAIINRKRPHEPRNIAAWRLPGIKWMRLSGVRYMPDAAAYVPELVGLVPTLASDIMGRNEYNAVIEFKGQHRGGSAEKKIFAAINDMAHLCDDRKTVGAVILDTPALTDQQIVAFKSDGALHSVAVLTRKEVSAGLLVPELVRVAKQRNRLRPRIRGGKYVPSKRPSRAEMALAGRYAQRNAMKDAMRKYGSAGLLR